MSSLTISRIRQDAKGRVFVVWGKSEREFADLASLRAFVLDDGAVTVESLLLRLALRQAAKAGGGLAAIRTAAEGKTATFDVDTATLSIT